MAKHALSKIPEPVRAALEATGLPFDLHNPGRGAVKIRLDGRLVGAVSGSSKSDVSRATLNIVARIRRTAAEIKGAS